MDQITKIKEERALIAESVASRIRTFDVETEQLSLETDILRSLNEVRGFTDEESAIRKSLNKAIQSRVENEIEQLERDAQESEDTLKQRKAQGFFQKQAGTQRRGAMDDADTKVQESLATRNSYSMSGNTLKTNEANVDLAKNLKEFNIEAGKNTLFWDTINVKIAEATERAGRFSETLAETAFDGVKDGFKGLLKDLSAGTMSAGDAFLKMAASIAGKMQDKLFDQAADRMTAGLFDMMGMNKFHTGGIVTNFASGGRTKSDVPAMLTAGEYVVRKKAVDSIGRQALEKMNRGESLETLFEKPNSESFDVLGGDMQSFGSPSNSPMQALSAPIIDPLKSGGMLSENSPTSSGSETGSASERIEERLKEINNNFKEGGSISKSTTNTIEKLFSGGMVGYSSGGYVSNIQELGRTKDQNRYDVGLGLGMMGGTGLAAYMGRDKSPAGSPPEPPNMNKLNTSSTLDLDIRDPRLSSKFRKMDTTSQEYGKYLLEKYDYNVQKQNKKVADRAQYISSIGNAIASFAGAAIGNKIGDSIGNRVNGARMNGNGYSVGKGPSGEVVKIHRDSKGKLYAMEGGKKVDFMAGDGKSLSPASKHMSDWAVENGKTGTGALSGKDAAKWWSSYTASGRPGFAEKFSAPSASLVGMTESMQRKDLVVGAAETTNFIENNQYSAKGNKRWRQDMGNVSMKLLDDPNSPYHRSGFTTKELMQYMNQGGSITNNSASSKTVINKNIEQELNRIFNESISPQAKPMKFSSGGIVNHYNKGGNVSSGPLVFRDGQFMNNPKTGQSLDQEYPGMFNKFSVSQSMRGYSDGGSVRGPAGIDKVGPVMLDEGEFVIKSRSVQKMEREYPGMLEKLNSGGGFADGGMVSNQNSNTSNTNNTSSQSNSSNTEDNSSNNVTVNINVGSSSDSGGSTSVEGNATQGQTAMAGKLKAAVLQVLAEEQRVGGMLRGN